MKPAGKHILVRFQKHWKLLVWLEVALYTVGTILMLWLLSLNWIISGIGGAIAFGGLSLLRKPWTIDLIKVSRHIDHKSQKLEYSSGLLLKPVDNLSSLALLQQHKISGILNTEIQHIKPQHQLNRAILISLLGLGIGYLGYQTDISDHFKNDQNSKAEKETIQFIPTDSASNSLNPPVLKSQVVSIRYPAYTGLENSTSTKMAITAVEGSRVSWKLTFEGEVDSVSIESSGKARLLDQKEAAFYGGTRLETSGFYNFKFKDTVGRTYISDVFPIEVLQDKAPEIRLKKLKQFTSFDYNEKKNVSFSASISDDFGIAEAYIIATVSKGTGESVKFREERLNFNSTVEKNQKQISLEKFINLDSLEMSVGDELYFYVEAKDARQPQPNTARSETYFAVIKDTTDYGPGVDAGMGVDLMPDYFRSQRQLIIDTKELISKRGKISSKEFNTTSNELGFDQKSLRLKYGQFMGDETEGLMSDEETATDAHDHDHEQDPLSEYTHDHDGENEHNLIASEEEHDHDHDQISEGEKDPLEPYLHDHGDPESASLFTDNLKVKLRRALNIMWDAELHLRLYEPEQSLPYQYEALELIQDIKNSARIYVHRIGFDPPPIKEKSRLTGDIESVSSNRKQETRAITDAFERIKESISRLETIKTSKLILNETDRTLLKQAGNELANKAIEEPGRYLKTLQQLKKLTELEETDLELIEEVQKGLLECLPQSQSQPQRQLESLNELDTLILKALE